MTRNINKIIKQPDLLSVRNFKLNNIKSKENIDPKELRNHLGQFATGVVIACARKNNFFAQKFFSEKLFTEKFYENFLNENNLLKKFEDFWHNFADQQNWQKRLINKLFSQNNIINKTDKLIEKPNNNPKNYFSENFLQKIKKIFAEEFFGMTINSFTSISLSPALISFCIDNKSGNLKFFKQNRYFLLNILSEEQQDLASAFATPKNSKKWSVEPYIFSKFGNPIFHNSLCFIECRKHKVIKMGDHHIIIGEVINFAKVNDKKPLLYFSGKYAQTK
ncbi:hypothetical protein LBMAG18_07090 [Alphaproteobacteria bacterium]|nr:hypothetical protein LBMAG18_07090 [Alphaproteobacteria bacterium]